MAANKTALDNIFKNVYEDGVSEAVNNRNPLRDIITTESSPFTGRKIIKAAHTSRNVSPMFVGEDAPFADAGRQGYVNMEVLQKKMMARIRMTYEVMQHSTSSEGAFISARKSEMQYIIDDLAQRDEYALCQDGRGVLSHIDDNTPSGSTTLEVDNPGGASSDTFGNRFIQPGMYIAAVSPSGTFRVDTSSDARSVRRVTAASSDGASITLDSAPPTVWADNDLLVQAANNNVSDIGGTSFERAWWGLMALVDNGDVRANYFGVTRSEVPHSQAFVDTVGTLSQNALQVAVDVVDQRLNGITNLFLCNHAVRRKIIEVAGGYTTSSATQPALRRYTDGGMNPDGGTVAFTQQEISWGGIPVRVIRDFPINVIMLLDTNQCGLMEYVSEKGKWLDEDGQVLRIDGGGGAEVRDAFWAAYRIMKQNYMDMPAVTARLEGLDGDTVEVARALGTG